MRATNRFQLTREETGCKLMESATDLKISLKRCPLGYEVEYELSGFTTGDTPAEAADLLRPVGSLLDEFGR